MKLKLYITALCTCILFLSIYGSISATSNQTNIISDGMTIPDNNAEIYYELQGILNTNGYNNYYSNEQVLFDDYELGDIIWQYTLTIYDPSPKAIAPIPDVNNDGIDDVIVCSEDDYVRCFDGSAIGTGSILWEHNIYSGDVYNQNGLDIINDVDSDGYKDIVVGAAWGARLIRCISGDSGTEIWTHDTHEYGSGGWVYMVNSSYDYDSDGILDVLAATGDDSSDTGPKRVYCLDGETGISIWERPLGGPVFSVIGVEDFTGDGHPDVIAGCSNNAETIGYAKGINGDTGAEIWSFATPGSSVWALEQIDDITSDGIKDVIIGDFSGNIFGLDATNGNVEFSKSIGTAIITRFAKIDDVNYDGHPDVIPAHSTIHTTQVIDGQTGDTIWSHVVADQPWNVARITDISGDAIDDVLVGTLYNNNYCYFLDGVDGSELEVISYGQAVDAIAAVPDAIGDSSMEMVAGGRNGKVTCFSGGKNSSHNPIKITANFTADLTTGGAPLTVQFTDLSTAENTTITSWQWDFNNDGTIDSTEQHPQWIYSTPGVFTVYLRVSDGIKFDVEIKDEYITILPASFEIRPVTGGLFRVKTIVKNTGDVSLDNIQWNITLNGGIILLGKETTGLIDILNVDESVEISSNVIVGLGQTSIIVTADASMGIHAQRLNDARVLLFFIVVTPGGGL
ncbi:MAG: VCBS repeat-containing protein, partial [Candidatus Thermoplasmatota archaeon]|nr:VCBS repeat-containing protein [Candidatus Thermoplasmatota archaeon]